MAGPLARGRPAQDPHRSGQAEVLRAGHVPLPVRAPGCTSATARATPPPTSSPAGSGCRASACCTRWAGTRSACRPRTTPSSTASTRASRRPQAIANFRRQIDSVGFAYDWEREIDTTDPGVREVDAVDLPEALRARPGLRGRRRRSTGARRARPAWPTRRSARAAASAAAPPVVRKDMRQWLLRITRYADRLLEDLDELDWPASTVAMQRNWIGRSEGAEVTFTTATPVAGRRDPRLHHPPRHALRRDVHGAGARAPAGRRADHAGAARGRRRVSGGGARARAISSGPTSPRRRRASFTGATATNPVNGKQIPIWIADYVLASYGTGAIMAVPAHDERDFEFAKKFGLPIVQVVAAGRRVDARSERGVCRRRRRRQLGAARRPADARGEEEDHRRAGGARRRQGRDQLPPARLGLLPPALLGRADPARPLPRPTASSRSRRRTCRCSLPDVESYAPTGTGESPLAAIESFVEHHLPEVRRPAPSARPTRCRSGRAPAGTTCATSTRRTTERAFDPTIEKQWMPVDLYVGGAEHAVLHLLYARFWHKVLFDLGLVSTKEPFQKLRHQGTVLAYSYQDAMGRYHELGEVELRGDDGAPEGHGREAEGRRREDGQVEAERRQPRRRRARLRRRRACASTRCSWASSSCPSPGTRAPSRA